MFDGVVTSGTGLSATLLNAGEALAPPPREDRVLLVELISSTSQKGNSGTEVTNRTNRTTET